MAGSAGSWAREQVYEYLLTQILSGDLAYLERIPPVIDTSLKLGVRYTAAMTAYRHLVEDGYLHGYPSTGYVVVFRGN